MDRHPGGETQTNYMIELAFLPKNSRFLDMGAGDGAALVILEKQGYQAVGIDRDPRSDLVLSGDFLHMEFPAGSFDGVLSQCAFYVSGDVPGAFREAARVLRTGGKLVVADVCYDPVQWIGQARQAGFAVRHMEDLTPLWKEYYFDALWRGDPVPKGRGCSYVLLVCERM